MAYGFCSQYPVTSAVASAWSLCSNTVRSSTAKTPKLRQSLRSPKKRLKPKNSPISSSHRAQKKGDAAILRPFSLSNEPLTSFPQQLRAVPASHTYPSNDRSPTAHAVWSQALHTHAALAAEIPAGPSLPDL